MDDTQTHTETQRSSPPDAAQETQMLAELGELIDYACSNLPVRPDPYAELYLDGAVDPMSTAPLPLVTSQRSSSGPRWPVMAAVVLLVLVVGSSASSTLVGVNKGALLPGAVMTIDSLPEPKDESRTLSTAIEMTPPLEATGASADDAAREPSTDARPSDQRVSARRRAGRTPAAAPVTATPAPATSAPAPPTVVEPTGQRRATGEEIDRVASLIDGALEQRGSAVEEQLLTSAPTRGQVVGGMRQVAGNVAHCGLGREGEVRVDVTLNGPTGRVTAVRVAGAQSTAERTCIERAVRGARFTPFENEAFRIGSYPFTLR